MRANKQYLLLVVALSLSICPRTAFSQIVVGVSAPISGPFAIVGKEVMDGTGAATEAINSQGGIRGKKIERILVDDNCAPDRARSQAERLVVQDKVSALIGYPCSATALAVRNVVTQYKVPAIMLAGTPA